MKFIISLLLATSVHAAQVIDLSQRPINEKSLMNEKLSRYSIHFDGPKTHTRFLQTYQGIPIWPQQIALAEQAGKVTNVYGHLIKDLEVDIPDVNPILTADEALERGQNFFRNHDKNKMFIALEWSYQSVKSDLRVYVDERTSRGHLAYVVSFYAHLPDRGQPSRPTMVIDALTGRLIMQMEGLTTVAHKAQGAGGNLKTGKYFYGKDRPKMNVTKEGSKCILQTERIKTIDLQHTTWGIEPYSFTCSENKEPVINGAFGPLNDAHYFAGVIVGMYQDWYKIFPLKSSHLIMHVHFVHDHENAFWNGQTMVFGDGKDIFYPLISLDVASHEIAHGFTEHNSGLIYKDQSGAINESFSDIAGEAAEYYLNKKNDFELGKDIYKAPGKALRYMANPRKDGKSIDHAILYYSGMDVHYSSGVFNKAFYLLAKTSGWNMRKAFDIFVKANRNYWTPTTDFNSGAKGVLDAAKDLGYPAKDVVAAFGIVGIKL